MLLLVLTVFSDRSVAQRTVPALHSIRSVYVEAFQGGPRAAFVRSRLLTKLSRSSEFAVVSDPKDTDAVLTGSASLWITGYHASSPHAIYRTSQDVPVYDVRLSLTLVNRQGNILWRGTFKPRFWGSGRVSDNVINQAIHDLKRIGR